ncbi:hypothetical protein K461DRAFT_265807 [Myriangium duriaei CBS 260.36]|uniref:GDP/GTP exchange factor Sec2 N-terminal domain-containing protein n=1 Tax=Myriangium duriaei CBS 260.36 TaxID=1168546 RepID=A0A9P4MNP4_9PEZI|nr:hypothetical protein K461DRAFT_265807 [Myriangium duriaei CBS 260.36]
MAFCSTCGAPTESRSKIDELENQVQVLTQQSVDALNRLAGYEEEIRQLRKQRAVAAPSTAPAANPAPGPGDPQHNHNSSVDSAASAGYGLSRFASFRMGRNPSTTTASNPSVDLGDLQSQLAKEQAARVEAEKKAEKLNSELEDLSVNLFEQANQMVATERRARSKLEERIAQLEKRDKDKTRRLDKIEGALNRLERVRALIGPPSPPI